MVTDELEEECKLTAYITMPGLVSFKRWLLLKYKTMYVQDLGRDMYSISHINVQRENGKAVCSSLAKKGCLLARMQ